MNIMLISQCSKNALVETRRILDQFAERRGDRAWQTPITQAGLETLRRLLRKTARKNTAVACHWIRGKDHSELLWIVGDARQFNVSGATPTNITQRNVLRCEDENDWHNLQVIYLLATLAALLHDLGKACLAFQQRLHSQGGFLRNLYRHEWISLRLFQAFVGNDKTDAQWLQRLIGPMDDGDARWLSSGFRDGIDTSANGNNPLAHLPPLARAIGWLILTHHRLPVMPDKDKPNQLGGKLREFNSVDLNNILERINSGWNEWVRPSERTEVETYWHFQHGLPTTLQPWRKQAARLSKRLLANTRKSDGTDWLDDPYVMHLARLTLMLADHHYSGLTEKGEREPSDPGYLLYANTNRKTGDYNQTLDEHLLGVAKHSGLIAHALPGFERHLPRLARHQGLRKRSVDPRFRWQDGAADTAAAMRERTARHGAFIVNMASTGSGKTLANARIMNALADPAKGMRCAFAMGLRTLTLQTGRAFRDALGLSDDELAIMVGGGANRELFEYYERIAENSGSASVQELLAEDGHVLFDGNDDDPLLQRLGHDAQTRKLLAAPLLVCTIDHLTPATESLRGGRQIAPMLRLMSGDLVLDEPDDFDIDDLPALTRLVHWAGLLGGRVLLSSATLPPALIEGLFRAYLDGRSWYQRNRGERPGEWPNICCAWFDEFSQAQHDCAATDVFRATHIAFAQKRHVRLGKEAVRRRSKLLPLSFTTQDIVERRQQFAEKIRDAAMGLHASNHSCDPLGGKRVSFGLVRMANISPLFDVALALYRLGAPAGTRIHLCVYHSQFPLLLRSAIEYQLDTALNRRQPNAVFDLPGIRRALDAYPENDHLFIVLGSPVTEVGRDHDYDWAVVEPSSMRSLIQLAGRVHRHRMGSVEHVNLLIFQTNLRHFEQPGDLAFYKPGFERDEPGFKLSTHLLEKLLDEQERSIIDARPRILPRSEKLMPTEHWVDLEHARLARQMLPAMNNVPSSGVRGRQPRPVLNATSHWMQPHVWLTGVLPQQQPFRFDPIKRIDLILLPNENEDNYALYSIAPGARKWEKLYVLIESKNHQVDLTFGDRIAPWGTADYLEALADQVGVLDISLRACAERFGIVSLPDATQGWRFHPILGFTRAV